MTPFSVTRLEPSQLSSTQRQVWQTLADANPLKTIFLQPEFILWCSQFNKKIKILYIEDGTNRAFIPVHINKRTAFEFINRLTDFCGPLCSPGYELDSRAVLRAAGLSSLHLKTSITPLVNSAVLQIWPSPYIDLGVEKDQWLQQLKQRKSSTLSSTLRKARKMSKEVGPLRFELHSDSSYAMQCLIDWKKAQRQRTATFDVFDIPWANKMLLALAKHQGQNFRGALSCLYAGDQLVAVHLGAHNQHTLHWWLTTYNPDFQRYSPGANLLIELCKAAQQIGISRIDLGFGDERYKTSFKNGDSKLYSAVADANPSMQILRQLYKSGINTLKKSPLEPQLRTIHRRITPRHYRD